jgi:hypothetical protein
MGGAPLGLLPVEMPGDLPARALNGPTYSASWVMSPSAVSVYPCPAGAARKSGCVATAACPMPLIASRDSRTPTVCNPNHRSSRPNPGVDLQVQMPVRIPRPATCSAAPRRRRAAAPGPAPPRGPTRVVAWSASQARIWVAAQSCAASYAAEMLGRSSAAKDHDFGAVDDYFDE